MLGVLCGKLFLLIFKPVPEGGLALDSLLRVFISRDVVLRLSLRSAWVARPVVATIHLGDFLPYRWLVLGNLLARKETLIH